MDLPWCTEPLLRQGRLLAAIMLLCVLCSFLALRTGSAYYGSPWRLGGLGHATWTQRRFFRLRCSPVGADPLQINLVSCMHLHGPQAQLAISASGGNCSRVHRHAAALNFCLKINFPLEFFGSEGTYVTLVAGAAQWARFRGPPITVQQEKAKKKGGKC